MRLIVSVMFLVGLYLGYVGLRVALDSGYSYVMARANAIAHLMAGGYHRWLLPYGISILFLIAALWLSIVAPMKMLWKLEVSNAYPFGWFTWILGAFAIGSLLHGLGRTLCNLDTKMAQEYLNEAKHAIQEGIPNEKT